MHLDNGQNGHAQPSSLGHATMAAAAANVPRRTYVEFDVPASCPLEERELTIQGERFAILRVTFKLPTLSEERRVITRTGDGGGVMFIHNATVEAMAYLNLAPVLTSLDKDGLPTVSFDADVTKGVEIKCSTVDGTSESRYSEMHPAMRTIVLLAYQSATTVSEQTATLFLGSRRQVTR